MQTILRQFLSVIIKVLSLYVLKIIMTTSLKIPYGNASFEEFNREHFAFVDKTIFIKHLEDQIFTKYPILLRPRRFGKSTFLKMLKYFYDFALADYYEETFKGTQIFDVDLPSHNSYHVLNFDFSTVYGDTLDEIKSSFKEELLDGIQNFKNRYPNFIFDLDPLTNQDPNSIMTSFFRAYSKFYPNQKKLYLLIDEYDNFTNNILIQDQELFKKITGANGFVKAFYSLIKKQTSSVIDKTFITGVTSISLDSLTSGFNIAKNISTIPEFNSYAGFTQNELKDLLLKLIDFKELNLDVNNLIKPLELYYNGYQFCKNAQEKVFNTSMCLNYISTIISEKRFVDPQFITDPACGIEINKLKQIFNNTDPNNISNIIKLYFNNNKIFTISALSQSINFNKNEQYSYEDLISILFYLGFLTIKPSNNFNEQIDFTIPNRITDTLFKEYFFKGHIVVQR